MADTPTNEAPETESQSSTGEAEDDLFTFPSAASQEFPLAPEGQHNVKVVRALFQMRENSFKPEAGKQPTANLLLQSDQTYKDETTGEERHYNLFKTLKISDHEKSSMFDFFNSVLGIEVPLNDKKQIVLERHIEKVEDGDDSIHFPQFEDLELSVIVKHKKNDEGKMKDRIDSWFASPDQKAANAALFQAPQKS